MIEKSPQSEDFKEQMRGSLLSETKNSRTVQVAKHSHVYTVGDERETVYFIEEGQVKLVMVSSVGRECLLAIHGAANVVPLPLEVEDERLAQRAVILDDQDAPLHAGPSIQVLRD